jgi:hypothetical protein
MGRVRSQDDECFDIFKSSSIRNDNHKDLFHHKYNNAIFCI